MAQSKVQGNYQYVAPEALFRDKMKGKDYMPADIYAVGCVFYQLLHEKTTKTAYWERVNLITTNSETQIRKKSLNFSSYKCAAQIRKIVERHKSCEMK